MPRPSIGVLQVLGRSAGGIARHVAQVTAMIDTDELRMDIAAPPDLPVAMPKRVFPVVIPDGVGGGHMRAVRKLRLLITRGDYQVVHAHGLRAGVDCAVAAARTGIPVVVTVHNLVRPEIAGPLKARAYRLSEPLATRLCARTFAVSEDIAARLRAAAPRSADKVEVLYLGVGDAPVVARTADEVRAELEVRAGAGLMVSVARLAPQKALHVLLGAMTRLPPEHVLAVVGEGPIRAELQETAAARGIAGRVRWLGWRGDVADIVAAADVYCLSSIWEGVPLSAQEAILLGTPVVATDVGGMSELVEDGRTGKLVRSGDPSALAAALQEVLDDPDLAARYARAALARLRARFSTERMRERLEETYRELGGIRQ